MIVCSCTGVTDRDIREAIAWMRASDPYTLITPGKIYRARRLRRLRPAVRRADAH